MPLQATSGAASYDAFGGGVPVVPVYIEDVMSTWLYTGTGASQTITNGIDLSGKGGMVWLKTRNVAGSHYVQDTARGATQSIYTNSTAASGTANILSSFTSSGFVDNNQFSNGDTIASWTFRKQPKFFDVVTYTGTGSNTTIAHALGSVPACILVKRTDTTGDWQVYHRSLANTEYLVLNSTAAKATGATRWNSTTPTSTVFSLGTDATVNASGGTYVAYLFAHDAGGFGLTGTDNVISCGSISVDATGKGSANLGWEPQWVLIKDITNAQSWQLFDSMRGFYNAFESGPLSIKVSPNNSATEAAFGQVGPTATGWGTDAGQLNASSTYIYIAIRRGPMKVPTSGTSVFSPNSVNGSTGQVVTTNFAVDSQIWNYTNGTSLNSHVYDRLRGISSTTTESGQGLVTSSTAAEVTDGYVRGWNNTGFQVPSGINGAPVIYYNFVRAPGFFDEVCYKGTGSATTVTHNLGAVPELMIVKVRNDAQVWQVYSAATGNAARLQLNTNDSAFTASAIWNTTTPTSSVFSIGTNVSVNGSGKTYVAYLFATCAGVSKVFSYTGNGSSQTINCGFTSGARFVLIKRTDSTGDWYVWDTARGIVSGNDSHLSLNSTAAEVTSDDTIDTDSTGFVVNQLSATDVNVSSATYIGLAIA